jgi:steroid 5-alpha reductase family enzyme
LLTLISPLFVIVLLTRISGIPTLVQKAKRQWGDDPDYQAYVKSTPILIPNLLKR